MSAVLHSVPSTATAADTQPRVRFGNVEPAAVALLKQLDPLVAVITLFACVLAYSQPFADTTLGVGLLTFLIANPIFTRSPRHSGIAGSRLSTTYSRILIEWALVVAILLFLGFAFKVSATVSRLVMVSWFVATPVALLALHGLRLRAHSMLAAHNGPRYIIVGANNVGFELLRRLPQKGFLGFFDFRSADRVSQVIDPEKLAGHCRDIANYARTHGVTAIYIALPLSNVPRIGVMIRELRDTTAYSENDEQPMWWLIVSPPRKMRRWPPMSVPAVFDAAPAVHNAGRPSAHGTQCPQLGTKTSTTWSPFARSSTPSPSASTMPAASWPSSMGVGRGRSPLMTERSEWHSPAAAIFTSTSPRPGGLSSTSSIASGRVRSYGGSTPIAFSTAPWVFIGVLRRKG